MRNILFYKRKIIIIKKGIIQKIGVFLFVKVFDGEDEEEQMIADITEEEKPYLIDDGYIEGFESRFAKVWYVQNPEICKLTFTIPWGNDQAEQYYWNQMQSKGFLEIYNDEGIMKGDILMIKSYYGGLDDKYVLY